jgi:hypothetical protein
MWATEGLFIKKRWFVMNQWRFHEVHWRCVLCREVFSISERETKSRLVQLRTIGDVREISERISCCFSSSAEKLGKLAWMRIGIK